MLVQRSVERQLGAGGRGLGAGDWGSGAEAGAGGRDEGLGPEAIAPHKKFTPKFRGSEGGAETLVAPPIHPLPSPSESGCVCKGRPWSQPAILPKRLNIERKSKSKPYPESSGFCCVFTATSVSNASF